MMPCFYSISDGSLLCPRPRRLPCFGSDLKYVAHLHHNYEEIVMICLLCLIFILVSDMYTAFAFLVYFYFPDANQS